MRKLFIVFLASLAAITVTGSFSESAHSAIKKVAALNKTGRTPQKVVNTILHGTGVPSSSLGANGDFYIDLNTYNMYGPKSSGRWSAPTSLKGAQGVAGPVGPQGVAGRSADRVTNVSSQSPIAIAGPSGPVGPRGEKGETGAPGATGAPGVAGSPGATGAPGVAGSPGATGAPEIGRAHV